MEKNVRKILGDYDLSDHYKKVKALYDGYRFGNLLERRKCYSN